MLQNMLGLNKKSGSFDKRLSEYDKNTRQMMIPEKNHRNLLRNKYLSSPKTRDYNILLKKP